MTDKTPESAETEAGKPKAAPPMHESPSPDDAARRDAPPANRMRNVVPVLYLAGFIVLGAAIVWLWQNPPIVFPAPSSPEVEQLRQEVNALNTKLTRLEQRPVPVMSLPPDLAPLAARVAALEARQLPPPVDLTRLDAAIAELKKRPLGDPALATRMDAMAGRQDALTARVDAAETALTHRLDSVEARLAPLEEDAGKITSLANRSARIARIQAAQAALNSGMSIGDLPGAPAALTRYASAAPPTDASLRLAFPAVADAAMAASRPSVDDKPFLYRAWARAQDLVTLRQGDHVIVGDPAAGVLARARAALDAGDLSGALVALGTLTGPAAAAMAEWKSRAEGLVAARKALADMAAHT
jgi:hypothetical protein